MSDLAATNCQNSCSSGCGCGNDFGFNNCFWLILILLCCNNGNDCGCGSSLFSAAVATAAVSAQTEMAVDAAAS